MEWIKRNVGLVALIACAIALPLGIWGPGLWDPWEMNRSFVARRLAEAPRVLVAEARTRQDAASLAASLGAGLADDASVGSTADLGSPAAVLETARTQLADHVYRVVVLDVDAKVKSDADEEGLRPIADLLKTSAPLNLSTTFVLTSASGAVDPAAIREKAIARAVRQASGSGADTGDLADVLDDRVKAAPAAGLKDAVSDALGGDAFLAQFKTGGRTAFLPPLDPWLVSVSFRAFGLTEFSARLPGVLVAVLVLVLVWSATRRFADDKVAAVAVVALATSPLFFSSARFVANEQSFLLFLGLGAVAYGAVILDRHGWKAHALLLAALLLLWLSCGMTGVVTLAALVVAYPIVAADARRPVLVAAGATVGLAGLLALATFLPDGAFARQFRFTAATFAGGMRADVRSWDFVIKEIGFGLFPWSALLPLSVMAVVGARAEVRRERLLLLLWAVAPLLVLMVTVRPMYHTLYAGVPALAILNALYVREAEDDALESRLLAFFCFGLFLVMLKDVLQSPAPLVSYLTTDPMFSEPGKGDIVFPSVRLPLLGLASAGLAGAALFAGGGRLVTFAAGLPERLSRGHLYRVVLISLAGIVLADWIIFLALKWDIVSGAAGPDAAVGAVLLRIFLTGPDVAVLYLAILLVVAARHGAWLRRRCEAVLGAGRVAALGAAIVGLERPRATFGIVGIGAVGLALSMAFGLYPELSYHLSQKHIIETYKESSARSPGELFRHGVFAGGGSEDSNFYTGQVKDMPARSEVIERLKDAARRTFFVIPKTQWSEVNSAIRAAMGGKSAPVLDDRSSRFILVASSLAPGETDLNWLANQVMTQGQFDALQGVVRETVNFEDKLQLVGYSLDSNAVRRGGTATLKMYFKVLDKVTTSYRIFMHVDRQGSSSRIHGDHWVMNLVKETEEQTSCVGCFATTHWLKGDIVIDTYGIEVPIGSPSGPHDIWMGFYNPGDDRRLTVKDFDKAKVRHDGQNRVRVGVLTVE